MTYIRLPRGFVYLVAIIDWYSPKVLSWRLSNTMDAAFCVDALEEALRLHGKPEIFNNDQGSQFTSKAFTDVLKDAGIASAWTAEELALGAGAHGSLHPRLGLPKGRETLLLVAGSSNGIPKARANSPFPTWFESAAIPLACRPHDCLPVLLTVTWCR